MLKMYFLCSIVFLLHIQVLSISSVETKSLLTRWDLTPSIAARPVVFDRIGRHGIGDVDYKQPIDILAYDEDDPNYNDGTEHQKDNNETGKPKKAPIFNNTKEEMHYYRTKVAKEDRIYKDKISVDFSKDFYESMAKLSDESEYYQPVGGLKNTSQLPRRKGSFQSDMFLPIADVDRGNWTTCNEFAKGATFRADNVVNVPWIPFYIWSTKVVTKASQHWFSHPSKKIVEYYKYLYEPYAKKIKWKNQKLLMRERREALLIAEDRRGLFHALPKLAWQPDGAVKGINNTFPLATIRMKRLGPYLALMYCDNVDKYATIMAVEGTEPGTSTDKRKKASILKFRGVGQSTTGNIEVENRDQEMLESEKEMDINMEEAPTTPNIDD